jgi:uncharacterized membrane protein YgaE (UPF0421/DUF939 family)
VDTPVRLSPRLEELIDGAARRGRRSLRARVRRMSAKSWLVGQSAVAAGLAWFVASSVLGHPSPLFAPIVAVVCLGMSYGQRLRRVAEATVGVAVGILVADLFVSLVGRGTWQIILVVALSMMAALFLDAGGLLVTQAAIQGITVTVLLPPSSTAVSRWLDAVVGGGVALLAASVVPAAALRRPRVEAARLAQAIAELMRCAARSARDGDLDQAVVALARARETEALVHELRSAAEEGLSVIASSPFHRTHEPHVRRMADLIDPLDYAIRNARVLVRRVLIGLADDERVPPDYIDALEDLAVATDVIARALSENASPEVGRGGLVEAGQRTAELARTQHLSTEVLLAQMRSIVVDLLQVTGLSVDEAVAMLPPVEPHGA